METRHGIQIPLPLVEHGHEGKSADQGRTDKSFGESYRTHGQGEPPPVEVEPEEPEK